MDDTVKKSLKTVSLLVFSAMVFCLGIYYFMGKQSALEFIGGYLIEFSLSMDNLFVFISIFTAFAVPVEYQHRCLTYGIIGAIVLRFIFILLGVTIVHSFSWVLYIFGLVLIISGIKMFKKTEKHKDVKNSPAIKILGKIMPVSDHFDGHNFITHINGKRYATPLLAVLFIIEFSDVLFAIDSVPAVFSVTTNLFIVYTSNIFAILGLRQLYFVLEHLQECFCYVRYGVAVILTFTGIKLAALMFDFHISIVSSISIIFCVLILSVVLSIYLNRK
ncbi:MAG: TerC/Alx family metal homeostasis membrane protein [Clostridia bacterium]|nr:TerC/Alx family metal homeostasis membrane protein [Clostridia bacterium]MDD4798010.1 TerC/Alx family metal homeostasis membrane protein [Clostridia bacterium]